MIRKKNLKIDLIIDILGVKYLDQNLSLLDKYGKLILFAVMDGKISEINAARILMKNLTIIGSTLRNKNEKQKSLLFQEACKNLLPHIFEGTIRPLISKIFPLKDYIHAHQYIKSGKNIGKVILVTD